MLFKNNGENMQILFNENNNKSGGVGKLVKI